MLVYVCAKSEFSFLVITERKMMLQKLPFCVPRFHGSVVSSFSPPTRTKRRIVARVAFWDSGAVVNRAGGAEEQQVVVVTTTNGKPDVLRRQFGEVASAPNVKDDENNNGVDGSAGVEDIGMADAVKMQADNEKRRMTMQMINFVISNSVNLLFASVLLYTLFNIGKNFQNGGGAGGMGGGGGGIMGFTRSRAKLVEGGGKGKDGEGEVPNTTFDKVAGLDGAKRELQEVVDFLKNPEKYARVGAVIPKGVLLEGASGCGKTLLARAVAGESGVPFFSCSASEFVEMFVGVGASRVRNLFQQAKEKAPCIVFIDEIDAVGKSRGGASGGIGGGNDEREQTVNQLLTEMNGFEPNQGVIVIGATNRADILDKALLRPGRFDRKISIGLPDVKGREDVFGVHTMNKPVNASVNFNKLARVTPGFSGADIEALCNEAAIFAARAGRDRIMQADFDEALEKVLIGLERDGSLISKDKRYVVAVHEAGHALTAMLLEGFDEVRKVTISPRGSSGGVTQFLPQQDQMDSGLYSKDYLEKQLVVALGGRAAEQAVFGEQRITTGASADMQQVYKISRAMVTQYGFNNVIGNIAFPAQEMHFVLSQYTQKTIDSEILATADEAYKIALNMVRDNRPKLDAIAEVLMAKESVSGDELKKVIGQV